MSKYDVLISTTRGGVFAAIAQNKKAEDSLWTWGEELLPRTGIDIGILRTAFGLTFYAETEEAKGAIMGKMKERALTFGYAEV